MRAAASSSDVPVKGHVDARTISESSGETKRVGPPRGLGRSMTRSHVRGSFRRMGPSRRGFLLLAALAAGAASGCVQEAPRANFECFRGCSHDKDACVLAAGNSAELSLCDARQQRCTGECAP